MTYRIVHRTKYRYSEPVTVSQHAARMEPRSTALQQTSGFTLSIKPAPALQSTRTDYFGNNVCVFSVQGLHQELEVIASSIVTLRRPDELLFAASPSYASVRRLYLDPVSPSLCDPYQFVFNSLHVQARQEFAEYALASFTPETPLLAGARDLTHRIHKDFKFDPTATTIATPLEEVWTKRRGVCQDFAHLGIACLRSIGLPARYVSGYLRTQPPAGHPRLVGADQSHAWFSLHCPDAGWIDFDPTNDTVPGQEHPVVAVGRDFSDVSPLVGLLTGGGKHVVIVGVDVEEV